MYKSNNFIVETNINRDEYLCCKICNTSFKTVGNFVKHIKKVHGYKSLYEYDVNFYLDKIPLCLESNKISDWKVKGYLFRYHAFCVEYKFLEYRLNTCLNSRIKKALNSEYKTKYMNFEYLLTIMTPSEILNFWTYLFNPDTNYWKRLSDNWYDDVWTSEAKEKYKQSILNYQPIILQSILSITGWIQRGRTVEDREQWIKNNNIDFKSCFKNNSELQKELSKRSHERYSKLTLIEQRQESPRCKEYWIKKGYTEEDSIELVHKWQITNGLNYYIEKYGKEEGNIKFNERIAQWQNTLHENNDMNEIHQRQTRTLNYCIKTYGELNGKIYYANYHWGQDIKTIQEFDDYFNSLILPYTIQFYDKQLRDSILKSQQYKCGECGCLHTERIFELHHIDFNKINDDRKNLIYLCINCHSRTKKHHRDKWIEYYKNKNKQFYE